MIITYNRLVSKRNNAQASFSTIDVLLKKRFDLVPNLVASVKQYMEHEQNVLMEITNLRSRIADQKGLNEDRMHDESKLSGLLGQLAISMENYPELKSDRNVAQLQASLNEIEEQISAARRAFNANVNVYNTQCQKFPSNIVALLFKFKPMSFFEVAEAEKENVNVDKLFNS
jgi:LemA protein